MFSLLHGYAPKSYGGNMLGIRDMLDYSLRGQASVKKLMSQCDHNRTEASRGKLFS